MIARRTLLVLVNNIIGAFLGFFALQFITRLPKTGDISSYGLYTWASSALGIAFLIATLGFPQAHVKRVNEKIDEGTANGTYFTIKVVLTALFALAVLSGIFVWTVALGKGFTDSTTLPILYVVLAAYVLLSFRGFFDAVFQAHRHTARGESVLFVDTVASVLGVTLVYGLFARSNGTPVPFGSFLDRLLGAFHVEGPMDPATVGLFLATAYMLGRGISLLYAGVQFLIHRYPMSAPSRTVYRSYREFGLPLAIAGGLTVLYANIDRVFLGVFWTSTEVANFQVPFQILTPMLLVSIALGTLLFPTISRLQTEGRLDDVRTHTLQAERYLTMVLVPQVVLALVFAEEGINIFNAQYVGQANVLRLLLVYVFLNVLIVPARSLILGTGQPKFLYQLGFLNVVVVVGLNLVAIPRQGLGLRETGAAIVAGIGSLVSYLYIKRAARPILGPDFVPPGFFRQALAGLVLGLVLWLAKGAVGGQAFHQFWRLGLVAAAACGVYLGLLILLREFTRKDWDFFWDLVHPGKLAGYVGQELRGRTKQP